MLQHEKICSQTRKFIHICDDVSLLCSRITSSTKHRQSFNLSDPNPSKDTDSTNNFAGVLFKLLYGLSNTNINISSNDWEKLFTSQESSIYDEAVIQGLRKQFLPCRLEQNFIPMYNQSLGKNPCSTLHEVCRQPIRIIFTESPPLIFTGPSSDKVKGILPRM